MGGAAAVVIRQEGRIVDAFRNAGAVTPDRAIPMSSITQHHWLAERKLKRHGVLCETAPGYFYIDVKKWEALRRLRRTVALVAVIVLVCGVLYTIYLAPKGM